MITIQQSKGEISGLHVANNKTEDFKILIAALDTQETAEIAREYFSDSNMSHDNIEISEFRDIDTSFDRNYLIQNGY